ncbi:hypothetical protein BURCENBC7_AP6951 [Burkholderia cenocepacia BC7]|nr:hypothetical protein BURCENK562V_C1368 [Burkholderia cenocepacia K56-2Valvano]ERI28789.1 hypothetical protein BURCENBC7_AP6951 [Burkholderia cenocepacia BC7]
MGNLPEVDYAEETRMHDAVAFYRSGYEKTRIDITVDAGL